MPATKRNPYESAPSTYMQLRREAIKSHPRKYGDDELEQFERKQIVDDAAHALAVALVRRHDTALDGSHVACAVNIHVPSDAMVVWRADFEEIREWAIALYKFAKQAEAIAEGDHTKIVDGLIDHVRDSNRYLRDFSIAMLNMPDVVANCDE